MARSVNFVWNFVNELSQRSIKECGVFLSAFDMHHYTKGAGKELGLHSQTLQCIASEYVTRRKQFNKERLNWRKSGGAHDRDINAARNILAARHGRLAVGISVL
ncbi:hypothetical protein TOI97_09675 [Denitrificimonas sp. JX-1]|uniref:Transposase n=1 Tax=Denitrificimonas halotolerans TaxID=3098930 RepID=A0ABU5GS75_9GAMM|nr:hypothetical protein [Denitrificimonas sp. JX-1]MDY7219828.1 hypothetical protein [Denitrificimonas sp. JX-1]